MKNNVLKIFIIILAVIAVAAAFIGLVANGIDTPLTPTITQTTVPTVVATVVSTPEPNPVKLDCSPFGFNVNGFAVNDWAYFKEQNALFDPCVTLIMDDSGRALEIVRDQPDTFVVFRQYHWSDGDACLVKPYREQVDEFVTTFTNKAREMGMPEDSYKKIGLYGCSNEPSFGSTERLNRIIDEEIKFMEYARSKGITAVSGNWAVGTIQPEHVDAGYFDRWIRACNQYDCIMAFHEYTFGFLPFGVGAYNRACLLDYDCVQPNNWVGTEYVQAQRWFPSQSILTEDIPIGQAELAGYYFDSQPQAQASSGFLPPYYHLFRFLWIVIRANEIGEEVPYTILTESFHDRLDDIRNNGPDGVDVIKVLESQYGIWPEYLGDIRGTPSHCKLYEEFYYPYQSCAESVMQQWAWWADIIIAHPEFKVLGATAFTWSENEHWDEFNLSETEPYWNGREFHSLLAQWVADVIN